MTQNENIVKKYVLYAVNGMLSANEPVKQAYNAMVGRGLSDEFAKDEIGRALLGCMFEASKGMPDRFDDVLVKLQEGRNTQELFPDELYVSNDKPDIH